MVLLLAVICCCCGGTWLGPQAYHPAAGGGTAFSDDFNRADSDSLGANWTEIGGDCDIASNRMAPQGASYATAIYSATSAVGSVQYVKASLGGGGNSRYYTIQFRYVDASSAYYDLEFGASNDTTVYWGSFSSVHTGWTQIDTGTLALTGGDVIGATITGTGTSTVIRIWKNPTNLPTTASDWDGDATPDLTFTADPGTSADAGTYVGIGGYNCASLSNFFDFFGGSLP